MDEAPPPDEPGLSEVDPLFESLYGELRAIANSILGRSRDAHTLTPTALVHEAYVRLAAAGSGEWSDRRHFFCVACKVIRRTLLEYARNKNAQKRGGHWLRVTLQGVEVEQKADVDYLDLDVALTQLESLDPRKARVVELKYFCGLGNVEVASILDISKTTVEEDWRFTRAWLGKNLA